MSVFAMQPTSIPPPSYTSIRTRPPAYKPPRTQNTPQNHQQQQQHSSITTPTATYQPSLTPTSSTTSSPPPYTTNPLTRQQTSPQQQHPREPNRILTFFSKLQFPPSPMPTTTQPISLPNHPSTAPSQTKVLDAEDYIYAVAETQNLARRSYIDVGVERDDEHGRARGRADEWCCGCIWIGPLVVGSPWITPYVFF